MTTAHGPDRATVLHTFLTFVLGGSVVGIAVLAEIPPGGAVMIALVATALIGNTAAIIWRAAIRRSNRSELRIDQNAVLARLVGGALLGISAVALLALLLVDFEPVTGILIIATLLMGCLVIRWGGQVKGQTL